MTSPFHSMGLSTKIILVVVAVLVTVVGVNYAVFMSGYKQSAQDAMMEKAAAFTAVADEAKNHQSRLIADGAVDSKKLIAEATEQIKSGQIKSYSESKFFHAIPVVTGWTAAAFSIIASCADCL